MEEKGFIWQPYGDYITKSNIRNLMNRCCVETYEDFVHCSTHYPGLFWNICLEDLGVEWFKSYRQVFDSSKGIPWTRWFLGGKINIVHNCLDRHIRDGKGSRIAFFWEGSDGACQQITYQELYNLVGKISRSFKKIGIRKGDTVGIYMSFMPESIAIMLSAMKIGAIPLLIMSGFGPQALVERLNIVGAKALFTSDGFPLRNKTIELKNVIHEALENVPSLKKVVVIERAGVKSAMTSPRDIFWPEFLNLGACFKEVRTAKLKSEDPALILFTSGTSGKPKAVVHTHAGILAQVAKEIKYCFDYHDEDVFFWYTDLGWMMAPWEILGVQFLGGTYVVFEGKPDWPDTGRLFGIIEKYKVSIFGITPTVLRMIRARGENVIKEYDLSSLRILGSTGEPFDETTYEWYFHGIGGARCPIINITGGTELIGCFLAPVPITPLKSCTVGQYGGLGMDVEVFNEEGKPVRDEIGHLVCRKPFPSMTKSFVGDDERYLETYFSHWPGVWYHGDFVKVDKDGYWFAYGRSDDVIKIAGRRIGPGEIEESVLKHSSVKEVAAIGAPDEIRGERLVCFVVLKDADDISENELKKHCEILLGKTLVPDKIYFVSALPKTRSGKIPRGLIKQVFLGKEIKDTTSIDNPQVLEEISKLAPEEKERP